MPNWTQEQLNIIDLKDKDIIVSAAAGSGKTAVLIERIARLIKEGKADISRVLMITFTVKAALEMKEKLQIALDEALALDPSKELSKQRKLLESADIKTIDSFCQQAVRNHFDKVGIDIRFRLLSEEMNGGFVAEILNDLMEEEYRKRTPEFLKLLATYGKIKNDARLKDIIQGLNDFSQSNEDPNGWMDKALLSHVSGVDEFQDSPLGRYLTDEIIPQDHLELQNLMNQMEELVREEPRYEGILDSDLENLQEFAMSLKKKDLGEVYGSPYVKVRKPPIPSIQQGPTHERYGKIRERYYKILGKYRESLLDMLQVLDLAQGEMKYLIGLTKRYQNMLMEQKREKNLFDFNDIVHFTSEIMKVEEVRKAYQDHYDYIFIDEFQDTNGVQKSIFTSMKGDGNHLFFVGDVKQSIYRFRLADSSIFVETMEEYGQTDEPGKVSITLNRNFRSSQSIVDGVNALFTKLMTKSVSTVDYLLDGRLEYGSGLAHSGPIETYVITDTGIPSDVVDADLEEVDGEEVPDDFEESNGRTDSVFNRDKYEMEAEICARRIRQLVRGEGDGPPVRYEDITILANSIRFIYPIYKKVFEEQGIPIHGELDTGFMSSMKVHFVMDFLEVINNVYQDIPLLNILKSSVYGFDLGELALIRKGVSSRDQIHLIDSLRLYETTGESEVIRNKIQWFMESIESMKVASKEKGLADFIIDLMMDTGYYFTIFQMKNHEEEALNLIELVRIAGEYESQYDGRLRGFLSFFREIKEKELDLASSTLISETADVVKMQTIHKSKGLEYDNVFLVSLGNQWNKRGSGELRFNQKLGIGGKYLDQTKRLRFKTLAYEILSKASDHEAMEDQLNLLYVAMTRGKSRLFLVGTDKKLEQHKGTWMVSPIEGVRAATSFYELILPLAYFDDEVKTKFEVVEDPKVDVETLTPEGIVVLQEMVPPYIDRRVEQIPRKLSATDFLKTDSMEAALSRDLLRNQLKNKPDFLMKKEINAVERGILFHLMMEIIDEQLVWTQESLNSHLDDLVNQGILRQQEREVIDLEGVLGFLDSDIGTRLRRSNLVEKEKAFNLLVDPTLIKEGYSGGDRILVQGIIDLYFTEGDQAILIDYKTDRVEWGSLPEKVEEYRRQLSLYKLALEEIKGLKVTECYLYFSHIRAFQPVDL